MRFTPILVGLAGLVWMPGCNERRDTQSQYRVTTQKNMNARAALIAKIQQQGDPDDADSQPILISLEDFFEGNDDFGAIGPNLNPPPGPEKFYGVLKTIRGRNDVQDVLVRIRDIESEDTWPFSDTVYILTSASTPQVAQWLSALTPGEVYDDNQSHLIPDWPKGLPFVRELRPGMRIVYAWWD